MKKAIFLGLLCIASIGSYFLGRFNTHTDNLFSTEPTTFHGNPTPPEKLAERALRIAVINVYDGSGSKILLNDNSYDSVNLRNLTDVTIEIDGSAMALEEALQGGFITVDSMISLARQDAAAGVCNEVAKSENGLTQFDYHYSDFSIHYVYDIYETPDGKQHLIKDCSLYGGAGKPTFLYSWGKNGAIDYEDWGLTFTIAQQDSEGLTLRCTQSGGQQLGQLKVGISWLESKGGDPNAPSVNTLVEGAVPVPSIDLTMGGETELRCDLAETYGSLPAGEYTLVVQIEDQYDPESVTPMVRKFHDKQYYSINFQL